MRTERTINNFDFLRLFAAFAVMVGHSTVHLKLNFLWVGKNGLPWFHDGVGVFFIISGMLVYRSYEKCIQNKRPISDFYRNRFLRIAPAIYTYVFISIVVLFIVGAINFDTITHFSFWGWIFSNIILIPAFHPDVLKNIGVGVLNGSLWTIPVEFSFYLIVPVIFYFEKKIGVNRTITFLFVLGVISSSIIWGYNKLGLEPLWFKFFNITFFSGLIYFTFGVLWLRYWRDTPKSKYIFLTCIILYSLGEWVFQVRSYFGPFWVFIKAIPLSYAVIWFGFKGPVIFNKLTTKIGDLSYGVYIWHMVIVNLFLYLEIPTQLNWLPDTIILIFVFVITFVFAKFSWTFIEKPCLKLKRFTSRSTQITYNEFSA